MKAEATEIKYFLNRFLSPLLLLSFQLTAIPYTSGNNFSPENEFNNPFSEYSIQIFDGENNEKLIGATVINITQNPTGANGAITDIDGKAVLKNPAHRDMIRISYLGYSTLDIPFYSIREKKGIIKLYKDIDVLPTIEVTGRKDQATVEIPYEIQRISAKEIQYLNAQTSADILLEAGAYVQKSQMGGGSPILRGFEANRVLLVVDGVRMNNAIYRNGHLQNSITIDNSILEQAEVIYGPGALMYGSDALGGVVHYKTRDPKLHLSPDGYFRFTTNAFTRFSSANNEKTVHVDLDYGTQKWGSLTSVTYSDFGDLKAGSNRPEGYEDYGRRQYYAYRTEGVDQIIESGDPDIQRGTGYSQIDVLQKVKFQPSKHVYFILNTQYSISSDVPRYDVLQDTLASANKLKWAEWYYGPQQRMLASLKTKIEKPSGIFDKATLIASFQRIDEDRLRRRFNKTHRTFNLEGVQVFTLTGDFDKFLDKNRQHTFSYGFEGTHNNVTSQAGRLNIKTGEAIYDELSRYPSGGGTMTTYAGYLTYNWQNKNKTFNFNFGGRYTFNQLDFSYARSDEEIIDFPEAYFEGISISNNASNWGIGFTYNSKDNWLFKAVTSTAFRAPNLDDLAKVRPKNGKATVPNPDLKPEYSLNYEATIGKQIGKLDKNKKGAYLRLSATGFYTELTDIIVRQKGALPDGSTSIIVDDDVHEVQQNVNEGEAFIQGFSGNMELNWNDNIILRSGINYTQGRRVFKDAELGLDTLLPLDHIPPMYGRVSLIFQTKKLRLEGLARFNGAKPASEFAINNVEYVPECRCFLFDREGQADNIEYGLINKDAGPYESIYEGLPSWITYNIYLTYQFSKSFSINTGLENIGDIHYRNFGSGISAPGRNFSITLRGKF